MPVLLRFFLGAAFDCYYLLVTDRVLSWLCNDHQPTTVWTRLRNGAFPDGKVAGWIVITSIEYTFLLPRLALYQVAVTHRAQCSRFVHKGAPITTVRKA